MSCTAYILMNGVLTPNEDLSIGSQVTLTNQDDTGVTTWDWKIVSKPTGSAAALSGSSSAAAYFTPDVEGAYLIRLIVNEGLVTEEQGTSVGRVKTLHKSLLPHAKDETSEGHPVEGWAKAWRESYLKVDKAIGIPSDRRTVKYSGSATTGPVFLTVDGTMYTMANGDVIPSVRLATAADDKQAMFLFESGALAPGVITVLEHGMSESITLAGVSAGDKLYATANGAITKTSQAYLHRPIAYCIYASGGAARVWFNPVDYTLLSTLDHEQLQGLLGGAANAHYHLNQNQYNAVNGASSPSGTNVFVTTSVLGGYVPTTRRVDTSTGLTGGGVLSSDLTLVNDGVLTVNNLKGALTIAGETGGIDVSQSGTTITVKNLGVKSVAGTSGRITPDVASTGAVMLDLATIPGLTATTYGSATNIPVMTVDAYGRITAISNQSVTFNSGTVTSITLDTGSTGLKVNTNQTSQQITSSGTFTLSGTLDADNGGTGSSTYAAGDMLYAGSANPTSLSKIGWTANRVLLSSGTNQPQWGQLPLGNTSYVTGTLAVGNGGTGATTFTQNGVLYGNAANAVGVTAAGLNGEVFVGVTSSVPKFITMGGDASILSSNGNVTVSRINGATVPAAGSLTTGNVLKVTGASALGYGTVDLASANNVSGTLAVGSGGTGQNSIGATQILVGNASGGFDKRTFQNGTNTVVNTSTTGVIKIDASFTAPTQTQYGAMRNYIINGAFDFWQRLPDGGVVVLNTSNTVYVADRWCWFTNIDAASMTFNALRGNGGAGINEMNSFMSYNRQPGELTGSKVLAQGIESELIPTIAGRCLRLKFKYRFTAFTQDTMRYVNVYIKYTTDQNYVGKSPKSYFGIGTDVLTAQIDTSSLQVNTWHTFDQLTTKLPEDVRALGVVIEFNPTKDVVAGTAESFDVANVMLLDAGELGQYGTVDIPYLYASGTIANELVACQRYYEKSYDLDIIPDSSTSVPGGAETGMVSAGSYASGDVLPLGTHPRFKVIKSSVPSSVRLYSVIGTTMPGLFGYWTIKGVNTYKVKVGDVSTAGFIILLNQSLTPSSAWLAQGHWTADAEYY